MMKTGDCQAGSYDCFQGRTIVANSKDMEGKSA